MATTVNTNSHPDYLPARMLNEFVYCPRLFFYEHVEGLFADNRETVEGSLRHSRVDGGRGELTPAEWLVSAHHRHPLCGTCWPGVARISGSS